MAHIRGGEETGTRALLGVGLTVLVLAAPLVAGLDIYRPTPDQRIQGSDTTAEDEFGHAVAIHGDTGVVGAPGNGDGAAYVFEQTQDGWVQRARLVPSQDLVAGSFGDEVAAEDDLVAVAAPLGDEGDGFVNLYRETSDNAWTLEATLSPAVSGDNRNLGDGLAIDSGRVVAGVPGDDTAAENAGAVHLFEPDATGTWMRTATLIPSSATQNMGFGEAVDVTDRTLVAGAPDDDPHGEFSGSAYIFETTNGIWTQTTKLTAPDGEPGDLFGDTVATNGATIAVSGWRTDSNGFDRAGQVYLTTTDQAAESEPQILLNPLPEDNAQFGKSLDLDGHTLIVGMPGDETTGQNTGSAFAYTGSETAWLLHSRLGPETPDQVTTFGSSVAVDAGTVLSGSPTSEEALVYEGVVASTNWDGT